MTHDLVIRGGTLVDGTGAAPRTADVALTDGVVAEDLPGTVLHEGLPWTWETIEEYLDALDERRYDIDLAGQVCHAPVRLYVMGQRGADRSPATSDDIEAMGALAARAVQAGALGFSTSRSVLHKSSRGAPTPSYGAGRDELVGIAAAIGATGAGVLQVVSDLVDIDDEMATFVAMMRASGRPLSLSLPHRSPDDPFRTTLAAIEQANADGLEMRAVVAPRAIGVLVD